jgi:hypothetical protein
MHDQIYERDIARERFLRISSRTSIWICWLQTLGSTRYRITTSLILMKYPRLCTSAVALVCPCQHLPRSFNLFVAEGPRFDVPRNSSRGCKRGTYVVGQLSAVTVVTMVVHPGNRVYNQLESRSQMGSWCRKQAVSLSLVAKNQEHPKPRQNVSLTNLSLAMGS